MKNQRSSRSQNPECIAYTDGSALPTNPGHMGAGYVLQDRTGQEIEAQGFYLGHGTNNMAEYAAVIRAAEAALRHGASTLLLRTDSQLVANQIMGRWKVQTGHLERYRGRALHLLNQFDRWKIEWIRRRKNPHADALANQAARLQKDVGQRTERILSAIGDYMAGRKSRRARRVTA